MLLTHFRFWNFVGHSFRKVSVSVFHLLGLLHVLWEAICHLSHGINEERGAATVAG